RRRAELGLSQAVVAKRLGSSQSRVAKMEAGDPSVSLDLLLRALLALGATRHRTSDRCLVVPTAGVAPSGLEDRGGRPWRRCGYLGRLLGSNPRQWSG